MRYEAFTTNCRALEIRGTDFATRETLALALELRVEPRNVRMIVNLLIQMVGEDFDLQQARRAFETPRFDSPAIPFRPWEDYAELSTDRSFFCGGDREAEQFDRWLAVLSSDVRRRLVSFFAAPAHRFVLVVDLFASRADRCAVKLGVHETSIELSYFLPERFDLDPDPVRGAKVGASLLSHLRIGALYHEVLSVAGTDATPILALLAGESTPARPTRTPHGVLLS